MKIAKTTRIALFIPKFLWSLRSSIAKCAQPPYRWDTITFPRSPEGFLAAKNWKPDAVIGLFGREDLFKQAKSLKTITVNIHGGKHFHGLPQIGCDHLSTGKIAADYFLSIGFTTFAAIGFPNENPKDDLHITGFLSALNHQNCHVFDPQKKYPPYSQMKGTLIEPDDEALHRWIFSLPKPCAIFASSDMMAARVLRTAIHFDIPIPDSLSIVGVGNIEEFCLDLPIPLSSVAIPWQKIGNETIHFLSQALSGKKNKNHKILFPPLDVVVRPSSDTVCIQDKHLSDAIAFIRKNFASPISVPHILENVPIPRRSLERKFRSVLGRSPHEEIIRTRIDTAANFLAQTDLPLEEIAEKIGFCSAFRLSTEFKKLRQLSPSDYRKQFQT